MTLPGGLELTPEVAVFLGLAAVSALTAIGVVAFPNPVRAALCLVVNFFVLAFLYFGLSAQMLGIVQMMVYAGAIMVLFLFTIMLLNLGGVDAPQRKFDIKVPLGILMGVAFFGGVLVQVMLPMQSLTFVGSPNDYGTPQTIGGALFTQYAWPFLIASILLMVGIVGSILLAKRRMQ